MRVILGHVGCAVADEGTGVQPVVRAYCHRHQAEGSECPHGGEKDLDPLLTHHAFKGNQKVEEEVSEKLASGMQIKSIYRRAGEQGRT